MVTYYQGRTVLVTHEVFENTWPEQVSFRIEDLYDVYVTRGGGTGRLAVRSLGIPGLLLLAVIVSWPLLHADPAVRATLVVVAVAVALAAFYRRTRPAWELRATYLGSQVELFSSTDLQTFGQVKRALVRALESHVS